MTEHGIYCTLPPEKPIGGETRRFESGGLRELFPEREGKINLLPDGRSARKGTWA